LAAGAGLWQLAFRAVLVQLAQIVRGAGEQPFVFARGQAAPGHHGQFLAGLELPEHRLDGLGAASDMLVSRMVALLTAEEVDRAAAMKLQFDPPGS
jgi:hypothetical protein